ncbi:YopX family protein [Listeria monocytogenes]
MRDIEYRAFVKETKKMLPVTDLCFNETESVGVSGCGDANCTLCVDWYSFDDVVLMQYTGLKDKNGKKIFEGDIVRNVNGEYSYIGIVNKDRYTFYIKGVAPKDNYDFADVSDTVTGKSSLIVIGNIHENPELLEGTE